MATIGTIAIGLVARTEKFEKGLKRAERRLGRFGRQMKSQGRALAMTGAAMLAPVAAAVRSFANYGDAVAKMSRRTGLAVDTLSRLAYMAEISGSDIGALEKGVRRMARAIVDAGDGLAEYRRAFERIGIQVDELQGMGVEDVFMRIGGAIADIEDPILRAAAAQEIFGRSGTALLPLLDLGEQGMRTLAKRAEKLGIVLDAETAREAEQLTDALTDLKKGMQGIAIAIVKGLNINFDDLSERVAETVKKIRAWVKENGAAIPGLITLAARVTALGLALIALGHAARVAAIALGALRVALSVLTKHPLIALIALWGAAAAAIIRWGIKAHKAKYAIEDQTDALDDLDAKLDEVNDAFEQLKTDDIITDFQDLTAAVEETGDEIDDVVDTLEELARARLGIMTSGFGALDIGDLIGVDLGAERGDIEARIGQLLAYRDAIQNIIDEIQSPTFAGPREDAMAPWIESLAEVEEELRALQDRYTLIGKLQRKLGEDFNRQVERERESTERLTDIRMPGAAERGTIEGYRAVVEARLARQQGRYAAKTAENTAATAEAVRALHETVREGTASPWEIGR